MDHLSVRLRLLREERGETRSDLSRVVCMSKESIAGWESGRRDPDTETVVRLAEHFGVSTDYLLGHGDSRGCRPDDPDTLLAVALSADGALTPEDRQKERPEVCPLPQSGADGHGAPPKRPPARFQGPVARAVEDASGGSWIVRSFFRPLAPFSAPGTGRVPIQARTWRPGLRRLRPPGRKAPAPAHILRTIPIVR